MGKEQFHQPGYDPRDPDPEGSGLQSPLPSSGAMAPLPLDAVDIRILNLLQEDGRLSVRELAKKAGLSTND